MIEYIFNSGLSFTNYKMQNMPNIYNLLYIIINDLDEDKKKKHLSDIKMLCGLSFHDDFLSYVLRKNKDSNLLR